MYIEIDGDVKTRETPPTNGFYKDTILIYFPHLIISVYRCFSFSYSLMKHNDPCIVSACICEYSSSNLQSLLWLS